MSNEKSILSSSEVTPYVNQSKFREMVAKRKSGWRRFFWVLWALMGPGLLAAMANNDAGGAISYAVTGASRLHHSGHHRSRYHYLWRSTLWPCAKYQ
ncbi:hypothetical protein [Paenibacillus albiflavus]|uniref:hypothetical protein n=1 Tax=Paenibacillus albiflavus TaxID=2545760 RepID=UPI001F48E61F|nr:hypothetical protein [Paenibacillus albiflavus]